MRRTLAAVLAADVVGYSHLMEKDAEGTLESLRRLRAEVFGPIIAARRGRIVKSMGDGWLVLFTAASDAVECAMQIQDRQAEGSTLDEQEIQLRMGIHIGDVFEADEDIFGDAVNVAARLEGVAESGTLVISDAVFGSLDGSLRPSFDDGGEHRLKNIDRPVRVWSRGGGPLSTGAADTITRVQAGFPQLVVRPVTTTDDRPEVCELAEGLTGDLAVYLISARWLVSKVADAPEPGAYLLSGNLRARGTQLRLDTQLWGPQGTPLWSGKFDGTVEESFDWQDSVGEKIADEALGLVLRAEREALARVPEVDLTAEQLLLRGMMSFGEASNQSWGDALTAYSAALERNSEFVEALGEMIFHIIAGRSIGFASVEPFAARLFDWVDAARPYVESSPALDVAVAVADYVENGDGVSLRKAVSEVMRSAPFDPRILNYCGWGYLWLGEPEAAMGCFLRHPRHGRFNPYLPFIEAGAAMAAVMTNRYAQAIEHVDRGLAVTNDYPTLHRVRAAALAGLGRIDEARDALSELHRLIPSETLTTLRAHAAYAGNETGERFIESLRLAGMPE